MNKRKTILIVFMLSLIAFVLWGQTIYPGGSSGGGGGSSTAPCGSPCTVIGNVAAGAAVSGNPVSVAGSDGTNVRNLRTDTTGRLESSGAATAQADNSSNTPTVPTANGVAATFPSYLYIFDGSTWDRWTGTITGTIQPGNTPNTTPWLVAPATEATTANSALSSYLAATASTNSTSVKASAGNVYGYSVTNNTATLYYLRMYNSSSAPTCSSATGYVETITIPASVAGAGRERWHSVPQGFTTGIGYCITGGSASTDSSNAAAGVFVTILYK